VNSQVRKRIRYLFISILYNKKILIVGLHVDQRQLMLDALDGKIEGLQSHLTNAVKQLTKETDQFEVARKQLKENPELLTMLGIPEDILDDPEKWAELMETGLKELIQEQQVRD
jgi:hypothetical protein